MSSFGTTGGSANSDYPEKWANWVAVGQPCTTRQEAEFCREHIITILKPLDRFSLPPNNVPEDVLRAVVQSRISAAGMATLLELVHAKGGSIKDKTDSYGECPVVIKNAWLYVDGVYCPSRFQSSVCSARQNLAKVATLQHKLAVYEEGFEGDFEAYHDPKLGLHDKATREAHQTFLNCHQPSWRPHSVRRGSQGTAASVTAAQRSAFPAASRPPPGTGYVNPGSLAAGNTAAGFDFNSSPLNPWNTDAQSSGHAPQSAFDPHSNASLQPASGPPNTLPEGDLLMSTDFNWDDMANQLGTYLGGSGDSHGPM